MSATESVWISWERKENWTKSLPFLCSFNQSNTSKSLWTLKLRDLFSCTLTFVTHIWAWSCLKGAEIPPHVRRGCAACGCAACAYAAWLCSGCACAAWLCSGCACAAWLFGVCMCGVAVQRLCMCGVAVHVRGSLTVNCNRTMSFYSSGLWTVDADHIRRSKGFSGFPRLLF